VTGRWCWLSRGLLARVRGLARRGAAVALVAGLTAVTATAAGEFVRVRVETANVREGPGTRYDRLWTVDEDFPLRVIGKRGRWLKTRDFLDSEGWIFAPLTDHQPAVVVQVQDARIRSGPGLGYEVDWVADWGETMRVVSEKGAWLQVKHAEHGRGWIHRSLVWGP
jgi:SH3-like domain-containing protein